MIYGIIDRNIHNFYTYMSVVFNAIDNAQKDYNWMITNCLCYPKNKDIERMLNQEYCLLSGEELTDIIAKEDFQWVWAVLCGFTKDISLEEILKYPLPISLDHNGYFHSPISLQHPLSSVEIVPCDSSCTIIVSKDKAIVDSYRKHYPSVEDLSLFNQK